MSVSQFILYARKSKRHNWLRQGGAQTIEDVRDRQLLFFLRDCAYSHWDNVETAIVQFASNDNIPDNIKTLPQGADTQ